MKLTREAILEMPAGREMDVLVADRVMGWNCINPNEQGLGPYGVPPTERNTMHPIPRYSTYVEEVFKVEWVMKSRQGLYLTLNRLTNELWNAEFQAGEESHSAYAETAPLAICRAALLAVSEQEVSAS